MRLTIRDQEILLTLSSRIRMLSLEQIAHTWWQTSKDAVDAARRRLRALEESQLLASYRVRSLPLLDISSPVLSWRPGEPEPDVGAVAWKLQSRWQGDARPTQVFVATEQSARIFGGRATGKIKNQFQATHDLGVAQMYLQIRKERPELLEDWIGEDVYASKRKGQKLPDAVIASFPNATCNRVLLTDCTWPAYRARLHAECDRSATELCQLPIRSRVLSDRIGAEELATLITDEYLASNCDGLFLPLVDNLGIRLPIERIVESIRRRAELRFVVVDGAQAAGHVDLELHRNYCDFLLTGSHKWLRAFATMGIGFYGNPASAAYVTDSLGRFRSRRAIDDPLLDFAEELETGAANLFGETVQVAPLFIASAAVVDALEHRAEPVTDDSSDRLAALADGSPNWKSIRVDASLQSRIHLVRRREQTTNADNAEALRGMLRRRGVTATAYHDGTVRMSMPHGFSEHDWKVLESAFSRC